MYILFLLIIYLLLLLITNIYINYNIIRQDLNWVRRYLGIIPPVFHENLNTKNFLPLIINIFKKLFQKLALYPWPSFLNSLFAKM